MQELLIKASVLSVTGGTNLTSNAFGVVDAIVYIIFWAFVLFLGAICVKNIAELVSAINEKGAYKDSLIAAIATLIGIVALFILKAQIVDPALSGMKGAIGTMGAAYTAFLWR